MATAEELLAVVGSPVDSDAVRALVAADGLAASAEPDLEEGEPPRAYLSNPAAGYQLMHHCGRVATAFLYAEPAEGFLAFPGPLPGGLPRGATRAEVRARFGAPERSGEAVTIPRLGRQGAWDRFAVDAVRVHFQYTEPGRRVRLVSVMAAADAP
jgi:hypothetical protein